MNNNYNKNFELQTKNESILNIKNNLDQTNILNLNSQIGNATVGEHIDSYQLQNRLVGESDNGSTLSDKDYKSLQKKAIEASKNRIQVHWTNKKTGMECITIGPDSRCFCGHSQKAHAWQNTETKKVSCRCMGCKCKQFNQVFGRGSWWIKCICKHDHEAHVHQGLLKNCMKCKCEKFSSNFKCECGDTWDQHITQIETKAERQARGLRVENIGGVSDCQDAACGGMINQSSMVHGALKK